MRRLLIFTGLLCLLTVHPAGKAAAQQRTPVKKAAPAQKDEDDETGGLTRKERKRKEKEKKKEERERYERYKEKQDEYRRNAQTQRTTHPTLPARKKYEVQYGATKMKSAYRIEVLVPLYLDDLVKGGNLTYKDHVPERAAEGVAFYEGIALAADTLRAAGFNIELYVHDVASLGSSPELLVAMHRLDTADLIIGAVQARDVAPLADFAHRKAINFVSVLSPADGGVKDNPYFTMLQPTLRSHCEWITNNIAKKYPDRKVALLYRTTVQADENAYTYVAENTAQLQFARLDCSQLPSGQELASVFDTTRPNVVVIPIVDVSYADSLLKKLSGSFPGTHFDVYGMPPWNTMPSLRRATAFPNLKVKITCPFNYDSLDNSHIRYLGRMYARNYGGHPQELVYRGYETLYWYASLLQQYGTIFNPKYKDNTTAPFTDFDVRPSWDKLGNILYNENHNLFLSTYEGGIFRVQ